MEYKVEHSISNWNFYSHLYTNYFSYHIVKTNKKTQRIVSFKQQQQYTIKILLVLVSSAC